MSTAISAPDADQLALLADAISDVGYWTWWAQKLPDIFQVEFAGTQLYFAPPAAPDEPPSSRIALRFQQPTSVCFLYRGQPATDFAWVEQLYEDQLEPPTCSYGEVSFGNEAVLSTLLVQATQQQLVHGYPPTDEAFLREPVRLVGWCGDYGFALAAPALLLMTHVGELALAQVAEANRQWWSEYWRTYWAKRSTADALPYDYACEVTIPVQADAPVADDSP